VALASRSRTISAIIDASLRSWFNSLARSLGGRGRAWALTAALGGLLVGWLYYGSSSIGQQVGGTQSDLVLMAIPATATTLAMCGYATLMASIFGLDRNLLENMLVLLPVRRDDRQAALRWLTCIFGLIFGLVWSLPLLILSIPRDPLGRFILYVLAYLSITIFGVLATQFTLISFKLLFRNVFRLPMALATGFPALGIAIFLLWIMLSGIGMNRRAPHGPAQWLAQGPISLGRSEGFPWPFIGLVALVVATGVALRVVDLLPPMSLQPRRIRGRPRAALQLSPSISLTKLEVRQWFRFPTNGISLVLFLGFAAVTLLYAYSRENSEAALPGLYLVFTLIATLGVSSYGATRSWHWMYRICGRDYYWIRYKVLAAFLLWIPFTTAIAALGVLVGAISWGQFAGLIPMLALELVLGLLVGLVLPVSQEQSIGGVISEGTAVLLVLATTYGLQAIPGVDSRSKSLGLVAFLLAGVGLGYVRLARYLARA
jgi:hypothetical protein